MVVELLSKQARARAYGQARAMLLLLCSVIVVGFAWFGLWYVAKGLFIIILSVSTKSSKC